MKKSEKIAEAMAHYTAKVYVLKDPKIGEPGFDWKVGHLTWGDVFLVVHDAKTFEEAWEWLYANYRRDTA